MEDRRIMSYIRVSAKDQNEQRQVDAVFNYCLLKGLKINERDIYKEKKSGKDFNRDEYIAMKRALHKGDLLIVKELDRLGRNYKELKDEWREIVDVIGADIVILDMELLNTANKTGLEKQLISDIVFGILAYMAEKEREKNKQRQREGIEIAKKLGKYKGRCRVEIKDKVRFEFCYNKWKSGQITAISCMKELGLKRNTFYRRVKEYEEAQILDYGSTKLI